jgi:hypothetical protein
MTKYPDNSGCSRISSHPMHTGQHQHQTNKLFSCQTPPTLHSTPLVPPKHTMLFLFLFPLLALTHLPPSTETDAIRNTLALWSFYLDTGNYTSLSQVFTSDATLTLPAPFGNSTGLPAIEAVLIKAAGNDTTVHALTWQEIVVLDGNRKAMVRTGYAIPHSPNLSWEWRIFTPTSFTDYHFGTGQLKTTIWGYYVDELTKNDNGWRIAKRETISIIKA